MFVDNIGNTNSFFYNSIYFSNNRIPFNVSETDSTFYDNLDDLIIDLGDIPIPSPVKNEVDNRIAILNKLNSGADQNLNHALSRSRTIAAYLDDVDGLLKRIEENTDQAAKSTTHDADRSELNAEVQAILTEISELYIHAKDGNEPILQGGAATIKLSLNAASVQFENGDVGLGTLGLDSFSVSTKSTSDSGQTTIDNARDLIKSQKVKVAAQIETFDQRKKSLHLNQRA